MVESMVNMNSELQCGDGQLNACLLDNSTIPWNWGYWDNHYHYWYPQYPVIQQEKSKTEQAFKIVAKLLEKKIVEKLTVAKFIELVNEISSII